MNKKQCDIAIIGAGAAGCMAAIQAASLNAHVILLERNTSLAQKILLTGNGRCNLTNAASVDQYIKVFKHSGKFLGTAFAKFFSHDLCDFFSQKGLKFKIEDKGKVFPDTDKARSIVTILGQYLKENNVDVVFNAQVLELNNNKTHFLIHAQNNLLVETKKIILATGGACYPSTGSDGSGARIAEKLGHTLIPFSPGLVSLKTAEPWVKDLQGLSFSNVCITVDSAKKKTSGPGDILFTHFGLSGPLILDESADIIFNLGSKNALKLTINLIPSLSKDQLAAKLAQTFLAQGTSQACNLLNNFLPKRMAPIFLSLANVRPDKMLNQITKKERLVIIEMLKRFPLTITGALSMDHAMVSNGGIDIHDIHQKTMESKLVPGLYFAGEMIDGRAPSGGYNLQQAFSTGFLAGESAAKSLEKHD